MKTTKKLKAYKAVNIRADGKYDCRGFVFETGKLYKHEGSISICNRGFHCCENQSDVYKYYTFGGNTEVFEVEIPEGSEFEEEGNKWCVSAIKLIRPVDDKFFNNGSKNVGHSNTGHSNTGDWNTGDSNTGDKNTGHRNTGHSNTGHSNTGDWNTGDKNTGNWNTGNWNTGNWNTGDWNTGHSNTGDWNTGDSNTGNRNTGNWNTGSWNTANYQTGLFNTVEQPVSLFNGAAFVLMSEVKNHPGYVALWSVPFKLTKWVNNADLPDHEKTGQYTDGKQVPISFKAACKEWWANMSSENKKLVQTLPGFSASIFKEVTGIKV